MLQRMYTIDEHIWYENASNFYLSTSAKRFSKTIIHDYRLNDCIETKGQHKKDWWKTKISSRYVSIKTTPLLTDIKTLKVSMEGSNTSINLKHPTSPRTRKKIEPKKRFPLIRSFTSKRSFTTKWQEGSAEKAEGRYRNPGNFCSIGFAVVRLLTGRGSACLSGARGRGWGDISLGRQIASPLDSVYPSSPFPCIPVTHRSATVPYK